MMAHSKGTQFLRVPAAPRPRSAKFLPTARAAVAGPARRDMSSFKELIRVRAPCTRSARSKHCGHCVIDPPVTEDERLTDALAAFGLLCDRAIEYLDLFTWDGSESSGASGSTPA
jgi:hypothetical protein